MCEDFSIAGARQLVKAVVMLAVEDYRSAVFYDDAGMKRECEQFFRDIGFAEKYIERLENGVIRFREMLTSCQAALSGTVRRAFVCPICGSNVSCSFNKLRRARCDGCGMSGSIVQNRTNHAS